MTRFDAPLGVQIRLLTLLYSSLLAIGALWGLLSQAWSVAAVLAAVLGLAWFFSVRGYEISDHMLRIHRPGRVTRVDLRNLSDARLAEDLVRRSFSLWSTRGFFGVMGYLHKRGLGVYRTYLTDPARAVLLTFHSGAPVLVSPGDPDAFLSAVHGLKPSSHERNHGGAGPSGSARS
jgi:hypothetical protein